MKGVRKADNYSRPVKVRNHTTAAGVLIARSVCRTLAIGHEAV